MKREINPRLNTIPTTIQFIFELSKSVGLAKKFNDMTQEYILLSPNSCRKSENEENTTALGITEFFLRCIAWLCLRNVCSLLYYTTEWSVCNIHHGWIWNLGQYTEISFDSPIYLRMNVVMLSLNLLAFDQQPTPSTIARSIVVDLNATLHCQCITVQILSDPGTSM